MYCCVMVCMMERSSVVREKGSEGMQTRFEAVRRLDRRFCDREGRTPGHCLEPWPQTGRGEERRPWFLENDRLLIKSPGRADETFRHVAGVFSPKRSRPLLFRTWPTSEAASRDLCWHSPCSAPQKVQSMLANLACSRLAWTFQVPQTVSPLASTSTSVSIRSTPCVPGPAPRVG